jgi:hypothetical protein
VFSNTLVRISFKNLFSTSLAETKFGPPLVAHDVETSPALWWPRALHRYTRSVGIIEYLLAFIAVVFAVLGSAIVYAARFRWKISRAVALTETLPRKDPVGVEALRRP